MRWILVINHDEGGAADDLWPWLYTHEVVDDGDVQIVDGVGLWRWLYTHEVVDDGDVDGVGDGCTPTRWLTMVMLMELSADDLSGRHVGVSVCGDGAETTENDYTPPNEHTVCGCTTRHYAGIARGCRCKNENLFSAVH